MVKHTQTIRPEIADELSVFDHFVWTNLGLRGYIEVWHTFVLRLWVDKVLYVARLLLIFLCDPIYIWPRLLLLFLKLLIKIYYLFNKLFEYFYGILHQGCKTDFFSVFPLHNEDLSLLGKIYFSNTNHIRK